MTFKILIFFLIGVFIYKREQGLNSVPAEQSRAEGNFASLSWKQKWLQVWEFFI